VSDFGLTTFREDLKKGQQQQMQGSIHWTAPEILNESDNVDYVQADVHFSLLDPPLYYLSHLPCIAPDRRCTRLASCCGRFSLASSHLKVSGTYMNQHVGHFLLMSAHYVDPSLSLALLLLSLASVAVAVIRDGLRPTMPEDLEESDFTSLVSTCWHQDPSIRYHLLNDSLLVLICL
jgi:hypothetical protein